MAGTGDLERIWVGLRRSDVFPMGPLSSLLGLMGKREYVISPSGVEALRGPVVDALRASTAIPGVFPPVRISHHYLMDGGVANNAPIAQAIQL